MKPAAVALNARIAVIAPASSARPERIQAGLEALRALGFDAVPGEHTLGKCAPYFSGTVEERLNDLHDAFLDPDVKAVFCIRGGYGCNYLLEGLDLNLIRANPKPFFGYSDLTALQTWMMDQAEIPTFHGPMVAADFALTEGVHMASLRAALSGGTVEAGSSEGLRILRPGKARGVIYGGCLSLLTASAGTRFEPQTEGKLLFLEDLAAKPYQIDRMLRQLVLGGKLDGVTGFIFGEMVDCVSPGASPDLLDQVILRVLDGFDGPIVTGLRSGHVSRGNVTLPMGIEAELIAGDEPVLRYLEPAVKA
ncbi:MAG: LD-carboxypeptidase [Acidobacteria bacterium]|nr:LD-carboxypeptidase [Acidobacteriota bacterium]MBW4043415.1 LD-carboxypeptidase [Acidobacteriota bacterium]